MFASVSYGIDAYHLRIINTRHDEACIHMPRLSMLCSVLKLKGEYRHSSGVIRKLCFTSLFVLDHGVKNSFCPRRCDAFILVSCIDANHWKGSEKTLPSRFGIPLKFTINKYHSAILRPLVVCHLDLNAD